MDKSLRRHSSDSTPHSMRSTAQPLTAGKSMRLGTTKTGKSQAGPSCGTGRTGPYTLGLGKAQRETTGVCQLELGLHARQLGSTGS